MKKYRIIVFGCQMNEHDSEVLAGILESMGYCQAGNSEDPDIILINTCCVRKTAENKVFSLLGRLRRQKAQNPNLIIGVCGCMPQQEGMAERIKQLFPHVDLIFGTHNVHQLPELIGKVIEGQKQVLEIWPGYGGELREELPVKRKEGVRAWVTIMYGCNNFCTYCIVPYVRGREKSRSPEAVYEEVARLAGEGFKEVILLGQNVNSYGKDLGVKTDFASLLESLENIDGIDRIRYMTSHPRDFSLRLVEAIAASKKVCEHFHLPVQAGSNRILKKMNRGYTREEYVDLIRYIKSLIPHATVTTDIMVGFPGETDEDFNDTLDLVREIRFDSAYTFVYNIRPGTPAAEMPDQVAENVKKERIQALIKLQNKISLERNEEEVGQTQEVLVEGEKDRGSGFIYGRNRGNKTVIFSGDPSLVGKVVPVTVTGARLAHLTGILSYNYHQEGSR
ncbi:2-methylthioadenine synthetase [Pelotomaculum thermopropionicum SI]|uniref:tRNA-2-methylthio-N(6)-dimethylallyladenosine synthase n=1 Tax=Pelotomaculum thermopropionicum (strain DSM 13744 / JCM 10971 / SI) TaxID=370438 RepID=MIAB_PELTS|nr:RecName: Full=tRNA-2-methylthio-N(6)-dimethylallyladenosine synthase; AltName: Full=(Dimethylallyl)adenosine tRNA methylthiotransferase MiaB; AltName: Full=tRNA-i(6)A37 methylthiotransferase [Pelotomaculum thermopropionicum SI]BAF59519.1 2-methylthioadenine synthetase [Pelotomaculum thermopropionicum SI]